MKPDEFRALYERLRKQSDERGASRSALDLITPAHVTAAAREVRSGLRVSLAAPVDTVGGPDNPQHAQHRMTGGVDIGPADRGLHFATDHFAMNIHGDADSHIDALCHVIYEGTVHDGTKADAITASGAGRQSIALAAEGIVGRGVLLDIPRLRGVPWLEPGDHVTEEDLLAAEAAQQVRVGLGDLLFVRVGHRHRRARLGSWDAAHARAGLHPTAVGFLADRGVAVLGSDGNNDTAPSAVDGVGFPVHVLCIHALGLHLLDYLQFEELADICAQENRWSFLCVIAPLRLPRATGSPVNPITVL